MTTLEFDADPTAAERVVLKPSLFRAFRELIYDTTGISLGSNKQEFVQSRLRKRLRQQNLDSFDAYFHLLKYNDPQGVEMQEMINRVTTNKTNFFREMHHFEYLKDVALRRIIQEGEQGLREKKLRIWCAASSTGEEPYSLAMTVRDAFVGHRGWDIRILASDIDTNVLDKAKAGAFSGELAVEIPKESLQKHFRRSGDQLIIRPETAQIVTFRQVNLLDEEWPIRTQFDAIFIRNVLIYFDAPTQERIMRHMGSHLQQDGSLFIGHSESLSSLSDMYVRIGKTVYERTDCPRQTKPQRPGNNAGGTAPAGDANGKTANSITARAKQNKPPVRPRPAAKPNRKRIVVGDVFASAKPAEVSTTLGSCVAVCLFDTDSRYGGMNHFALPSGASGSRNVASFGIHAMELLINEIMTMGGDRCALQAKVFGGAHVVSLPGESCVGERNGQFIREFLETESIPIAAKYLGGDRGMQVVFETHTGRARLKLLDKRSAIDADGDLEKVLAAPTPEPVSDITLF